jgi:hypothetical protein
MKGSHPENIVAKTGSPLKRKALNLQVLCGEDDGEDARRTSQRMIGLAIREIYSPLKSCNLNIKTDHVSFCGALLLWLRFKF